MGDFCCIQMRDNEEKKESKEQRLKREKERRTERERARAREREKAIDAHNYHFFLKIAINCPR